MLAHSTVVLARNLAPRTVNEDETNRETLSYAAAEVWSALTRTVEQDGMTLVSRDDDKHVLHVAYPFSWLHNNWGGVLTITCAPVQGESAASSTVVRIVSGAKDSTVRVRRIGNQILDRVHQELKRGKAPQSSQAASSAA